MFTPQSPTDKWLLAKGMVEQTDHQICQANVHLGHVHFVYTVLCAAFRRHFSTQHPLYDVLKFHCEGTTPHISTAWVVLGEAGSFGDLFYAGGYKGFIRLASKAYHERKYGQFDIYTLLHVSGLYYLNVWTTMLRIY